MSTQHTLLLCFLHDEDDLTPNHNQHHKHRAFDDSLHALHVCKSPSHKSELGVRVWLLGEIIFFHPLIFWILGGRNERSVASASKYLRQWRIYDQECGALDHNCNVCFVFFVWKYLPAVGEQFSAPKQTIVDKWRMMFMFFFCLKSKNDQWSNLSPLTLFVSKCFLIPDLFALLAGK